MYMPLVRKYGIRSFDDVIGQPIVVKILKNTLFLDHVFSVYLFAGKHGCGKTSTARLFSMALNCEQLSLFRKNPHEKIPCQSCPSCIAMQQMQHPDFIEIDAASHTGVDNVRILIESATLLPLLGKKKIYLIDEAHMLSKAACNAFLKILEEPPKDVVFILATTAPEKILETVRSRCFQLFFDPISENSLTDLLCLIAKNEEIAHTREGVSRIVSLSRGSARDALNMLDQTRLATKSITSESFHDIFGKYSDDDIINLFDYLFCKQSKTLLLSFFQKIIAPDQSIFNSLFERIIYSARALLWFLYGQQINNVFVEKFSLFKDVHPQLVIQFLSHLYQHETALRRSEQSILYFEIVVLLFLEKNTKQRAGIAENNALPLESPVSQKKSVPQDDKPQQNAIETKKESPATPNTASSVSFEQAIVTTEQKKDIKQNSNQWSDFLQHIISLQDPLLLSVFKQGNFHSFDPVTNLVTIAYPKERSFFSDIIADSKKDWNIALQKIFGDQTTLNVIFTAENTKEIIATQKQMPEQSVSTQSNAVSMATQNNKPEDKKTTYNKTTRSYQYAPKNFVKPAKIVDVTDAQKWQYANLLKSVFPGIITEIEKGDS